MTTYEDVLAAVTVPDGGRPVTDPATDEVLGHAPEHDARDLERAVQERARAVRVTGGRRSSGL